jgi:hypothetical protein
MDSKNPIEQDEEAQIEDPLADLERMFIQRYLAEKGYKWCDLANLPADEIKQIMTEACKYATARLAEIEAKSEFRQHIRYK